LLFPQGVQSATARLRLANAGTIVDQYIVRVEGLDPNWWSLSNDRPSLFPGDEVTLSLEVRTPVAQAAGSYSFRVVATSVSSPSQQAAVEGTVMIEGKAAVKSRLQPQRARGRRGRFRIETENVGTQPLEMTYSGYDTEDRCRLSFSADELAVPPGQAASVRLNVSARRNRWFGEPYKFNLRLAAVPRGHADLREALTGEFEHKPLFRSVVPFILLLLLILILVVLAVLVIALGGPGEIIDYFRTDFTDDVRERVRSLLE
jgi:hypothetical protein